MALIKCPECGKEISDRSTSCINCGYPISLEQHNKEIVENQTKADDDSIPKMIKTPKNKKIVIIGAISAVLLVLCAIIGVNKVSELQAEKEYQEKLEAERQAYKAMLKESRDNIAPYLEVIPCHPDEETGKILLPSELHDNIDNIDFLGLKGSISFSKNEYGTINTVCWKSHDFFTFDEHQDFVTKVDDFFGTKAVMNHYLIGEWTQKDYYWEDDTVPTVVVFYTSVRANHEQETDRIEIYWDMDAKMPD